MFEDWGINSLRNVLGKLLRDNASNINGWPKMAIMLHLLLKKWRTLTITPLFPTRGVMHQSYLCSCTSFSSFSIFCKYPFSLQILIFGINLYDEAKAKIINLAKCLVK
jgi:hypothetical protein